MVLETAFLGTKGSIQTDGFAPWKELRASYGDDFGVKNGSLRLENTYFWDIFLDISISQFGPTRNSGNVGDDGSHGCHYLGGSGGGSIDGDEGGQAEVSPEAHIATFKSIKCF